MKGESIETSKKTKRLLKALLIPRGLKHSNLSVTRRNRHPYTAAPMMDYTTAHFRYLCRLLSVNTWLYTEMEVDQTLVHTVRRRVL